MVERVRSKAPYRPLIVLRSSKHERTKVAKQPRPIDSSYEIHVQYIYLHFNCLNYNNVIPMQEFNLQ